MTFDSFLNLFYRYSNLIGSLIVFFIFWKKYSTVSRKAKIYQILLSSFFPIIGILQLMGRYDSGIFMFHHPISEPLVALFWILYFIFLWGTTLWVLLGEGAKVLIEIDLMDGPGLDKPLGIKIFFVCFSLLMPIILWLIHKK